jgi:hypothetical protein
MLDGGWASRQPGSPDAMPFRFRRADDVFTVVIWGAGLLGTAAVMALLFLWTAG